MIDILINKDNTLDENYVPSNLIYTDNNENNFHNYVDPNQKPCVTEEVLYHFEKMQEAAIKEGLYIIIDSGYRSYQYQKSIWNNTVIKKGIDYALKYVALPGTSEHQSGLAIDIAIIRNNKYSDEITEELDEYKWMIDNSYKYGFILRYPKGKESITGYNFEPWHFRYVGINIAALLKKDNISLEEYHMRKNINLKMVLKQE